ncbi:hypothetical protein [Sphingomonas sp. YL-JM2C]
MFMFGAVNVTRDRESDSGQDWSRLSFPIKLKNSHADRPSASMLTSAAASYAPLRSRTSAEAVYKLL